MYSRNVRQVSQRHPLLASQMPAFEMQPLARGKFCMLSLAPVTVVMVLHSQHPKTVVLLS